jgi:regulator of protease activity HflC (stomatin/prohibitin superfamily)
MIPVEQTRQILLESITDERLGSQKNEYLTGDENLLNIALRVDYRVGDPLEIARTGLFLVDEQLVKLAESSLVTVLTNASVNDLLGPRRGAIDQQFREHLQRESDQLALGIQITGANWSEVLPLKEVQESFESAQSAVNEAAGRLAQARTKAESNRIQTTSEVAKIKAEAETNASLTKSMAESESRRFKGILKQAQRTGFMQTAKTLWLDTVSEILPALKSRTVLATDQPTDLTIIRSAIPPEAKVSP